MCFSWFRFCLCDAVMGGRTSSKTWAGFIMTAALNQYAADAVFREMIHQVTYSELHVNGPCVLFWTLPCF